MDRDRHRGLARHVDDSLEAARVIVAERNKVVDALGAHVAQGHGRTLVAPFRAFGRDLEPDREQVPNTKNHQEGDEAYRQRLPYPRDSWLDGFSNHCLPPCNER